MHNLVETPIAAPPERVFAVVCDFTRYPEWNPFTPEVLGKCAPGEIVDVLVKLAGDPFRMKRRVLRADFASGFAWEGAAWYSGFCPGARAIRCRDDGRGGTIVVDDERIGGLAFTMPGRLRRAIRSQMEAFGAGLKQHVESGALERRSA